MAASVEQNKGPWNWDFLAAVVDFGIGRSIFVVALRRGLTLGPSGFEFMISPGSTNSSDDRITSACYIPGKPWSFCVGLAVEVLCRL